jgi:hypothetical protein
MLAAMGWIDALKQSLDIFGGQVNQARTSSRNDTSSQSQKVDPRELGFTNNAIAKMREWHVSEADVKDVFYHGGVVVKQNMMVKKYNGYEIGLYYFQDKQTERCIISSVWKRGRY